MNLRCAFVFLTAGLIGSSVDAQSTPGAATAKPSFDFSGLSYFHRWSKNNQHEFTPAGQEDFGKWTDMVTVNVYRAAREADALATKANAVLQNYKSHGARVLRTDSVPRTPERPAEHFIAVLFGRPEFIEVAFARFRLADGTGCSVVYSHRIYGNKAGEEASAWLKTNGEKFEKALMTSNAMPSPAALSRERL